MSFQQCHTLVLSREFLPLYFLNCVDAFLLVYSGRAEIVELFSDKKEIKSVSQSFFLPSIIRIPGLKYSKFSTRTPNRVSIFFRDNFTCGYCGRKLKLNECTIDHIVPKSKGGKWTWENLVTACRDCNRKKRDNIWVPKYVRARRPEVFEIQYKRLKGNLDETIERFLKEVIRWKIEVA